MYETCVECQNVLMIPRLGAKSSFSPMARAIEFVDGDHAGYVGALLVTPCGAYGSIATR